MDYDDEVVAMGQWDNCALFDFRVASWSPAK